MDCVPELGYDSGVDASTHTVVHEERVPVSITAYVGVRVLLGLYVS